MTLCFKSPRTATIAPQSPYSSLQFNFPLSSQFHARASTIMIGSGRKLLESPLESPDLRAWNAMEFDSVTTSKSRPALNHEIFRSWNGKQIHLRDEAEGFESGFRSSPQRSPQFYRSNYQSLSPPSKARAIASGQKELMEMVSHMPESCYELSLRDLVEEPRVLERQEETVIFARENRKSKKENSRPLVCNMENGGLYLKMGFPKSIGTKNNKKKMKKIDSALNTSAKVSPRPPPSADKDWWKRKFSGSYESENVGDGSSINNGSIKSSSSSSSNGSHGSNKNRTISARRNSSGGCWSWIYPKYYEQDE